MFEEFQPVHARLEWARGHARRVDALVDEWARGAIRVDKVAHPDHGGVTHRGEVVGEPPVEIALALGDVLQQSRATLDNLVTVLRGSVSKTTAFPVEKSSESFDRKVGTLLSGVPAWAVSVIRELQPFAVGDLRARGEWLPKLHDLAIIDRHRALILRAGLIDLDQVHVSSDGETSFAVGRNGRSVTIESTDPRAVPHFGATVGVPESGLPSLNPWGPTARDIAGLAVWQAAAIIDTIERESYGHSR